MEPGRLPSISKPSRKLSTNAVHPKEAYFTSSQASVLDTAPSEELSKSLSTSTLHRLRQRGAPPRPKLTADLASDVIKTYLLPLFESNGRAKKFLISRSNSESLEAVPGTVYGELRLSSMLADQIEELKRELSFNSQLLRDCLQAKEVALQQLSHSEALARSLEADSRLVRFTLQQTSRTAQAAELKTSLLEGQVNAYKRLFETVEAEKKQLVSEARENKAKIDIRW